MISHPDRRKAVRLISEAIHSGASKLKACKEIGISHKTYNRWILNGTVKADGRPDAVRPEPANKFSAEEKDVILETCNTNEFASLPPTQIVPTLADNGEYIGSESTFYRVLRESEQQHHRGRTSSLHKKTPDSYCASAPCQVWTWDITWLPGPVKGIFFYLYIILDIYSRKIVGWEIHECESAENASLLIKKSVLKEQCYSQPLVLHSDNGSPMKGATFLETLRRLEIIPSYSRPRVSNDNPFSESLFKTCKYRPEYTGKGFQTLSSARDWGLSFVIWYNTQHRHSKINFVTPDQRHNGEDPAILEKRKIVFQAAKKRHPERWSGSIRKWEVQTEVWLNPDRSENEKLVDNAA
ncbi:MAG: IS3 family transposase [Desulfobacteraceae bacterium]|nr:IS3 family transposase [Desulfobacteraceae bacterium]